MMLLVQKNSLQMCIHYSPAAVDSGLSETHVTFQVVFLKVVLCF